MTDHPKQPCLNKDASIPFTLSQIAETVLSQKLIAFHGILPRSHMTAEYLEDAVSSSLDIDPDLHENVVWVPRSHTSKSDIVLKNRNNFGISVKSGSMRNNMLKISGHRFSKANGDFNKINELLEMYLSDIMICFVYTNSHYEIFYVDKSIFVYPVCAKEWTAVMGSKTGRPQKFVFVSANGLVVDIIPNLSWQVWWSIPIVLCRKGKIIQIPKFLV
jgi:hypothetical protein